MDTYHVNSAALWAAAVSVDTGPAFEHARTVRDGDSRASNGGESVTETFDVIEHICAVMPSSAAYLLGGAFGLVRIEETLHRPDNRNTLKACRVQAATPLLFHTQSSMRCTPPRRTHMHGSLAVALIDHVHDDHQPLLVPYCFWLLTLFQVHLLLLDTGSLKVQGLFPS